MDGLAPKDFSNSCECVIEEDLPCTCRSCLLYYANLVRTRAELECRGEEEEEDDCDVCSVGKTGTESFYWNVIIVCFAEIAQLAIGDMRRRRRRRHVPVIIGGESVKCDGIYPKKGAREGGSRRSHLDFPGMTGRFSVEFGEAFRTLGQLGGFR